MGKMKALSIEFNHWFEVFYFKLLNDYHMTGEQAAAFFNDNLGTHASDKAQDIMFAERIKEATVKAGIERLINESPS